MLNKLGALAHHFWLQTCPNYAKINDYFQSMGAELSIEMTLDREYVAYLKNGFFQDSYAIGVPGAGLGGTAVGGVGATPNEAIIAAYEKARNPDICMLVERSSGAYFIFRPKPWDPYQWTVDSDYYEPRPDGGHVHNSPKPSPVPAS